MIKFKEWLSAAARLLLTVLITTPVVIVVPVVFLLIVIPPWFRYAGLQSSGVQTQAKIIAIEKSASIYGRPAASVDYRFSLPGQDQVSYTGKQSIASDPPPVGSTILIRYSRDNPSVSQIGDDSSLGLLLVETVLLGFLALFASIPTVALALRIATRIWGI